METTDSVGDRKDQAETLGLIDLVSVLALPLLKYVTLVTGQLL